MLLVKYVNCMHKNLPDENSKRFIAILNQKIEIGRLLNALGHMTTGLSGGYENKDELWLLRYQDRDGGMHPNISHFPFIVLKADNSNQIRTARSEAIARNIPFSDFTSTMTIGTSQEQQDATHKLPEAELEYYGIVMFGPTNILKQFTGKFSLFK